MKKKNSRAQFTNKHTSRLRAEILGLLERTNVYQLPERRVAAATAIIVANRDLRKTRNSDPEARVFSALRAVSGFIALAADNKVTTATLANADLLPVGHPSSRARHAMTASALRHARAQWTAADRSIDDSVRSLVASAHSATPGSIERRHAFLRIAALAPGAVPLTAAIDLNTQISLGSEFIAGFGIGGNSGAARSARAKLQRRDRKGQFAFMGGGFSFNVKGLDGATSKLSGRVVGASGTDLVEIEVKGNKNIPDGIYALPAGKGDSAKAILSPEAVEDLPEVAPRVSRREAIDVSTLERMDAPTGWNKQPSATGTGPDIFTSEDGYFVKKDGDTLTLHRADLSDNSIGEEVARGTSWSDIQKAALGDQDDYEKVLEAADAGGAARPPSGPSTDSLEPGEAPEGWTSSVSSTTGGVPDSWGHSASPGSGNSTAHTVTEKRDKDGNLVGYDVWRMGYAVDKPGDNTQIARDLQSWDDVNSAINADTAEVNRINGELQDARDKSAADVAKAEADRNALVEEFPDIVALENAEKSAFQQEIRDNRDKYMFNQPEGPLSDNVENYSDERIGNLVRDLEKIDNKTEKTNDRLDTLKAEQARREDVRNADRAAYEESIAREADRRKAEQDAYESKFSDRDWVVNELVGKINSLDTNYQYSDDYGAYSKGAAAESALKSFIEKANLTDAEKKQVLDATRDGRKDAASRYIGGPGEPPTGGPSALTDENATGTQILKALFDGTEGRPASEYSSALPENSEIVAVGGDGDTLYGRNADGSYYLASAEGADDYDVQQAEELDSSDPDFPTFLRDQFVEPTGGPGEPPTGGPGEPPTGGPSENPYSGPSRDELVRAEKAGIYSINYKSVKTEEDGTKTYLFDAKQYDPDSPDDVDSEDIELFIAIEPGEDPRYGFNDGQRGDSSTDAEDFFSQDQVDYMMQFAGESSTGAPSEPDASTGPEMPDFIDEQFDEMFQVSEDAYKVDIFSIYEPVGRTNEDSADFTDDPAVLSQKFSKQELTLALAQAVDSSGYGDLQFSEGEEPVKAEAIFTALELQGGDNPTRILAAIYDAGLGTDETPNTDMYLQRERDFDALDGDGEGGLIPVSAPESTFVTDVARNGILGTPSRTQLSIELMRDHVETNPKIVEIADQLQAIQDDGTAPGGSMSEEIIDKYMPWAFSNNPEEKAAFRGFWGLLMSIDGGASEPEDYTRSGIRTTMFASVEKHSGASTETEAIDAYNDFIAEFGGFSDFVSSKEAIANGDADLESDTTGAGFLRLMKASSRPNGTRLFRVINVSENNRELLEQYTTSGNIVGLDPRSFSTTDSTGGGYFDSIVWSSGNKSDNRIVFTAAPGEVNSLDITAVSWFEGEQEHLAHGQLEIGEVRRQPSGLPGRADEFIVELRRTSSTPDDLVAEQSASASSADTLDLETFDVSDWRQTGEQKGSNEGGFYEDANGVGYYVKTPKSQSHADNEVLASVFYEELGVPSAQVRIGDRDGNLRVVSKLIDGATTDLESRVDSDDNEYLDKLRADFAVDAWLSNWDVTGTGFDNVVTDANGDPIRVDPGGALMWRAQGEPKNGAFGNVAGEIDTLRDPQLAPYGAQVFGSLTDDDVRESAKKLLNITPSRIDEIVDRVVSDPDDSALLKERLKARREGILKRFNLSEKDTDVLGKPVPLTNSIGFEAQDLQPGDITANDSFVIENVFRDDSTPKGKISIQGYYPGHESQRKEWNEGTIIDAARGSTVPAKGDAPAIHRPKKPYAPTPPAFQGSIADEISKAESWAEVRDLIKGREIVFFDYETTGFGAGSGNNPVQLGAVKMRDGQVIDRFNLFMDPMENLGDWSRENLKDGDGNPLTDEFLSQQVGMGEAHSLFAEWAGADAILTAHNTPFDREVLERINAAENVDFTPAGYIDTLKLSRALLNKKTKSNPDGPDGHKLPQLADHYGIEFAGWHTADADAEATANLLNSMLDDAADRPDGADALGVVKDQPSEFEKQIAEHQAAVKEYQDALADYNAQLAVAAAWNCGDAGLTAAVGEGNGPCSVPSVDDLIDASTVKPGQLSDPEAITSGNPSVDTDLSGDAVEVPAFDGVDTRLPAGVDELPTEEVRQVNIAESFDEVAAQADMLLDPELFKHKNVTLKYLEQARDDVADVRAQLDSGEITEQQAIARLNDIIDALPEPKGSTDADVEIGVFRDTIIDLRSSLDNTAYRRPGGPDVPPIETHASRGYSKDGVFLTPGARVRDKWGYLGTVHRYNKNGWVNVFVIRDFDGKFQSKGTQHLTTVSDEDDQTPWIFDPKIPEGKRPSNWQELVPEAATSPKAEAPSGASEASEVDTLSVKENSTAAFTNRGIQYKIRPLHDDDKSWVSGLESQEKSDES